MSCVLDHVFDDVSCGSGLFEGARAYAVVWDVGVQFGVGVAFIWRRIAVFLYFLGVGVTNLRFQPHLLRGTYDPVVSIFNDPDVATRRPVRFHWVDVDEVFVEDDQFVAYREENFVRVGDDFHPVFCGLIGHLLANDP